MSGVLGTSLVTQVGFIVKDIEVTKKKWAEFLGLEEPPTVGAGEYEITQTIYKGEPAPNAAAKLAFFTVGENLQIELIEPNEAPSTWREFLDTHGEGVHHLAFGAANGMKNAVASCEAFGLIPQQAGNYGDGSGRYAYLSGEKDLKVFIELLESDNK
ncbi:MAG: VOC family protein [Clostridiales bacterium]|jgi:catechol 2,3-dioxygenase-like lactoylglutathione lyase family enzyme|nr:VOC family protein [Clostridiales bacterium]